MLVRLQYRNNATAVELDKSVLGPVDIRTGRVGGFFLVRCSLSPIRVPGPFTTSSFICRSVYTPCPSDIGEHATFSSQHRGCGMSHISQIYARNILITRSDTLEQIDISNRLIYKYSDISELALTSSDVINTVRRGKITLIG